MIENPCFAHFWVDFYVIVSFRYGDAVEELDESVDKILAALDFHNLSENTIVYFASDHGGHLESLGDDGQRTGGHNGLYKGACDAWRILGVNF